MTDVDAGSRPESAPTTSDMPPSRVPRSKAGEEKVVTHGHSNKTPKSACPPLSPEWHRPRKKTSLPWVNVNLCVHTFFNAYWLGLCLISKRAHL